MCGSPVQVTRVISSAEELTFDTVVLEKERCSIRPDAIGGLNGQELCIEIKVTHGIDDQKWGAIHSNNLSVIEIDLSAVDPMATPAELWSAILAPSNIHWIHHRKLSEIEHQLNVEFQNALKEAQARADKEQEQRHTQQAAFRRDLHDFLAAINERLAEVGGIYLPMWRHDKQAEQPARYWQVITTTPSDNPSLNLLQLHDDSSPDNDPMRVAVYWHIKKELGGLERDEITHRCRRHYSNQNTGYLAIAIIDIRPFWLAQYHGFRQTRQLPTSAIDHFLSGNVRSGRDTWGKPPMTAACEQALSLAATERQHNKRVEEQALRDQRRLQHEGHYEELQSMLIQELGSLHRIQSSLAREHVRVAARKAAIEAQRELIPDSLTALIKTWENVTEGVPIGRVRFAHICPVETLRNAPSLRFTYPDEWIYATHVDAIKLMVIDRLVAQGAAERSHSLEISTSLDDIQDHYRAVVQSLGRTGAMYGASKEAQTVATHADALSEADRRVRQALNAATSRAPAGVGPSDAIFMAKRYCATKPTRQFLADICEVATDSLNPLASQLLEHSFARLLADDLVSGGHARRVGSANGHSDELLVSL